MKTKIIATVLAVLVVLVGVALVAPSMIDWNQYKSQLTKAVYDATGLSLEIAGDLKLSVFPLPSANVKNVTLKNGDETLALIDGLSVRVALLPLLSKQVEVQNVTVEKPIITVATDANGKGSWVTDKLGAEKTPEEQAAAEQAGEPVSAPSVVVKDVRIRDAKVTYRDGKTAAVTNLEIPNLKARADSLQGPFGVNGSFAFNGLPLQVDGQVGRLQNDEKGTPVQFNATVDTDKAELDYSGVIVQGAEINLRGEVSAAVKSLPALLERMNGQKADLPPELQKPINLAGKLDVTGPTLRLSDVVLQAMDGSWKGMLAVNGIRGENQTKEIAVDLTADKKASGGNIAKLVSGSTIKAVAAQEGDAYVIKRAQVKTDMVAVDVGGRFVPAKSADSKALVVLTGTAESINLDEIMGGKAEAKPAAAKTASTSGNTTIKGMALPVDFDANMALGRLVFNGQSFNNIKLNASGRNNALTIQTLSLSTVGNSTVSVAGRVGDTVALSGLDVNVDVQSGDTEALMKAFNVQPPELQQKIGAMSAKARVTGAVSNLGFDASVNALKGTVGAAGKVAGIGGTPSISDLRLSLKHPSLNDALRVVAKDFKSDPYLAKPVSASALVNMQGKKFDLADIKGDIGPLPIISGKLSADMSSSIPSVAGQFSLGDLVLPGGTKEEKSAAAAPAGTAAPKGGGKWSTDPLNMTWMRNFNVDMTVAARSLKQGSWNLSQPKASVKLKDGTLTLSSLDANLYGGSFNMSGQAVLQTNNAVSAAFKGSATTLDGKSLLNAMMGRVANLMDAKIDSFTFDVKANGGSMDGLIRSLSGLVKVSGRDILIHGVDIPALASALSEDIKPGTAIKSLAGNVLEGGNTNFTTLEANMPISNGVVSLQPVKLDGPSALFDLSGNVNLPAWTLAVTNAVTVKQPADAPPFTMKFSGSLDNPGKDLGRSVVEDYLKRKLERKLGKILEDKGITDKLNEKLGIPLFGAQKQPATAPATAPANDNGAAAPATDAPAQQPAQQQQQPTVEDAARDLIRGLF